MCRAASFSTIGAMQRLEVPAREGVATLVRTGQRIRVVDTEGGQVGDCFAFNAADLTEHLSAPHTRAFNTRLFPQVGEPFVTNKRRPILTLAADDSPGIHDFLLAACDPDRYTGLGVKEWHASCAENLQLAMAAIGHEIVFIPQPVNVFMNIPVAGDTTVSFQPAQTKPGDSITFEAAMDCYFAISACPQDIVGINVGATTGMLLEIE